MHTGDKTYSCDVCQKSYVKNSDLSRHNKTTKHIKRMKSNKSDIPLIKSRFVDCENVSKKKISRKR